MLYRPVRTLIASQTRANVSFSLQTKRSVNFEGSFEVLNTILAQLTLREQFGIKNVTNMGFLLIMCLLLLPYTELIYTICTVINKSCDIGYLPVYLQPSTLNSVI